MATSWPVNAGSQHCRDCGGPVTTALNLAICQNTHPKRVCANLAATSRLYCEHCGKAVQGARTCGACGKAPSFP